MTSPAGVLLWFTDTSGVFFAHAWYETLDTRELHRFLQEELRPLCLSPERLAARVLAAFPPTEIRALEYGYEPEPAETIFVREDS